METKLTNMNGEPTASETVSLPSSPPTPPPSPPWIELPGDVTANILKRLGALEILKSAFNVCTTWQNVCLNPAMWRVIELDCMSYNPELYNVLCRCVVDLSQGQLIDLKISYFGDDELIHYIADRSSNLQRLTLERCENLSGTALSEAIKKLPQLEELHVHNKMSVAARIRGIDIEAIGISCPMLKSFSYNNTSSMFPVENEATDSNLCNQYAFAIGKAMPNLRYLQLLENGMKNEGLEAILDGCPHLESLDIRGCSGLDLKGALGRRCSQQIKDLRDPTNSKYFTWAGFSRTYLSYQLSTFDVGSLLSDLSFGDDGDYEYDINENALM